MVSFVSQEFTEEVELGNVYCKLLYQNMVAAPNARGAHGEGVMTLTREWIHTSAIRLAKDVSSSEGILHNAW